MAPAPKKRPARQKPLKRVEKRAVEQAKAELPDPKVSEAKRRRRQRAHERCMEQKGLLPGRKCGGTNVYGDPCGASPLRPGTVIEGTEVSGDWCLNHDPDLPEGTWKRFWQEKGVAAVTNRPRQPRPFEILAQAVQSAPGILFAAHLKTLGWELDPVTMTLTRSADGGAKIVGFSREGVARLSKHVDLTAQRQAEKDLSDRLFGKARQAMDLAGGSGTTMITLPQTTERAKIVVDVLMEAGALPGMGPAGGSGGAAENDAD